MNRHDATRLSVVWEWHDDSYDRAQITQNHDGWHITGRHGETRYVITLDAGFCCRTLEASHGTHALTLNRTKSGWLTEKAELVAQSAQVAHLDLGWTALTNTFPIKCLQATEQTTGVFDVLMVTLPNLDISVVPQSYTQQDHGWLYQNKASGFSANLTIDKNGLVTDYPGLCTQKDLGP